MNPVFSFYSSYYHPSTPRIFFFQCSLPVNMKGFLSKTDKFRFCMGHHQLKKKKTHTIQTKILIAVVKLDQFHDGTLIMAVKL